MRNAKQELLKVLESIPDYAHELKVVCASITFGEEDYCDKPKEFILKENHTVEQFNAFIESLDFEYDAGYGYQNLFGTIWFNNRTWAERSEYDGAEWWSYRTCPMIPEECSKST